ncbi:hypothetical protein Q5P01_005023 [Channa striata]|uniref:Uncharacterized protein n=1 Tax=Channa striata TaxID=64152 RepID=A0AA88NBR9_CHASR|nr:hypothetical protein Q5P01_005023 [Channa striata]
MMAAVQPSRRCAAAAVVRGEKDPLLLPPPPLESPSDVCLPPRPPLCGLSSLRHVSCAAVKRGADGRKISAPEEEEEEPVVDCTLRGRGAAHTHRRTHTHTHTEVFKLLLTVKSRPKMMKDHRPDQD